MKSSQKKVSGAALPTRTEELVFNAKAWGLRAQRKLQDTIARIPRHRCGRELENARMVGQSSSPLWSGEETSRMLIAGKIQNLRQATKNLDGLVVPGNQVFSFWKQIGRATARKGYATGRELREGCVIPTIGGGICQLSNSIYDAALQAGLTVIERHQHSQIIAGSLAEQGRDATVFWNYKDLRLSAPYPWKLEVKLDAKHLNVRILAQEAATKPMLWMPISSRKHVPDALGDCTQCGRTDCYLHVGDIPLHEHSTWLVTEEEWPEFSALRETAIPSETRIVSTKKEARPNLKMRIVNAHSKLLRRIHLWRGHPLPVAHNSRYQHIARYLAKQLDASDTRLVVPQSLLPWLWLHGELAGREYEVLMTALPIPEIQRRLDQATELYDETTTLSDFRADATLLEAERQALEHATHWITPHAEILRLAADKGKALDWCLPSSIGSNPSLPQATVNRQEVAPPDVYKIMLAASTLARKGIIELRQALKTLPFPTQLILPPGAMETPSFWEQINVCRVSSMAEGVCLADVVVLPAWVEHQPRGLLMAIGIGKTVIATPACGLPDTMPWIPVTPGDSQSLAQAIAHVREQHKHKQS